jgi:6-methylsalicylate decarboxylase
MSHLVCRLVGAPSGFAATECTRVDAPNATTSPRLVMIIDTHHHFYAPAYQKAWLDWENARGLPHYPSQVSWSLGKSLEEMDENDVSLAVLSLASTPGVWFDAGRQAAIEMARHCNEYGAGTVRDHPGRFGLFATLPMVDIDATLKEIEYAFAVLNADGVGLQTNYGDRWPGDPLYRPVFEELNRRRALVYFHPLVPTCCANINIGTFPAVIEVPHDTTRAAVSLLVSGTFTQCRNIRWLFSHGGGTLPMLAGRMEYFFNLRPDKDR